MDKPKTKFPKLITLFTCIFVVIAILLFYKSVYLTEKGKFIYPRYLPENGYVGKDLYLDLRFATNFFVNHKSAYIGDDPEHWYLQNGYPPLFTYYLYPFIRFQTPKIIAYYIVAGMTLSFYLLGILIFPMIWLKRIVVPYHILFVLLISLFAYGIQFELERGQFNLICFTLCLLSIYIFWFLPKFRWLAYILFFVSFQFKTFPIIFLPCFVTDIHKLKENIIRIGGLILAIFAGMFVMGIEGLNGFIRSSTSQIKSGVYIRDHGLSFGVDYLLNIFNITLRTDQITMIKMILTIIGLALLGYVFFRYLRENSAGGFFPPLIMACTIGALAIFPISKDYKLSILPSVLGIYFLYSEFRYKSLWGKLKWEYMIGLAIFATSNFIIIFSYAYKPVILQNSFPMLFVMLICTAFLEYVWSIRPKSISGSVTGELLAQDS